MGCDIHLHVEAKINNEWHHVSEDKIPRNYALFAKMANVRNYEDIAPIDSPRGFPGDETIITKLDSDRMDTDGHSHSWLGLEEIKILFNWIRVKTEEDKTLFGGDYHRYIHRCFSYVLGISIDDILFDEDFRPMQIEDLRFVFFFDN